jgi:hypothetical protein
MKRERNFGDVMMVSYGTVVTKLGILCEQRVFFLALPFDFNMNSYFCFLL